MSLDFCLNCLGVFVCIALLNGCFVNSACYNNADCPEGKYCVFETDASVETGASKGKCVHLCKSNSDCSEGEICDVITGKCYKPECQKDEDCKDGFTCNNGNCEALLPLICPEGMVPVAQSFCIDIYEASRPDADEVNYGTDNSMATSRPGVKPWWVTNNAEADAACRAAGKSLCTRAEWQRACIGPEETVYAYGDIYNPETCNGIDTYCRCEDDGPCGDRETCPFAGCLDVCGSDFHPMPTGSFTKCTNRWGVFDMNGNLWEHVLGGNDTQIRGGAFNCKNSKKLHRCDYVPGNWTPNAIGFRCCAEGTVGGDGGVESEAGK